MEFVTVFFPLYENMTSRARQTPQVSEQENYGEQTESMDNTNQRGDKYSVTALEEVLSNNPSSLLNFAASKDFSGENIVFLNHIRDWKAAWVEDSNRSDIPKGNELPRHLFNVGVEIYATFVNINTAQFPVNLEYGISRNLSNVFGQAAKLIDIPETANVVTPFDPPNPRSNDGISLGSFSRPSTGSTSEASTFSQGLSNTSSHNHEDILIRGLRNIVSIKPRLPSDLEIPNDFGASVFDAAQHSVKMLVLRDTWPKYVDAMKQSASPESQEEERNNTKKKFRFFGSKK